MSDDDRQVVLERHACNRHCKNGIRVLTAPGKDIGIVPEANVEILIPLLDARHAYKTFVKEIVERGRSECLGNPGLCRPF